MSPASTRAGAWASFCWRESSTRRSRGFHTMMARIVGGHEASIGLHRSAGFELVGIEREVGRKFHTWLDVVVMQRML